MANEGIRIKARIRLLPSEESGRTAPIVGTASYRPNHNFLDADNREMGMGSIDLPLDAVLHPGESIDIEMTLYPWPPDTDLSPGREWRIQEGGRLIGIGTVLSAVSPH
jgi:translation elongation factor EF-Tu-like GTPase